jgi:hypothetical protein
MRLFVASALLLLTAVLGCSSDVNVPTAGQDARPLPPELSALSKYGLAKFESQPGNGYESHFWTLKADTPIDQTDRELSAAFGSAWNGGDTDFTLVRADTSSVYIQLVDGDFTGGDGSELVPNTFGKATTVMVIETIRF